MIHRRKKRTVAILTILTFLLTLLPVGAGVALANPGYSVLSTPLVDDDIVDGLGTVFAEFPAGALEKDDSITLSLPEDFVFCQNRASRDPMTADQWANIGSTVDYTYAGINGVNYFKIPKLYDDKPNGLDGVPLTVTKLDDNEIQVTLNGDTKAGQMCYFYLYMGAVYIDSGYDGDIKLVADAPSGSGFGSGDMTVGRATGGEVTITVNDVKSFSDDVNVTFRIKEDVAGALEGKDESLKFVLPSGFAWTGTPAVNKIWGDEDLITKLTGKIKPDDDELLINLPGFQTNEASCFELTVTVSVDDETKAKTGDVVAKVRGESDVTVSELIVAVYGEYGTKIEAADAPKVIAGMLEQEIGNIIIKEDVDGSLVDGRTVILTLPSNAKWGAIDIDNDSGVGLTFEGFPGTDGKAAKWKVTGESTDAAELVLEDMEVVLEPGVTGDLEVEVSGTAGFSGKIKVAEVVASISAKAESTPDVIIGMHEQDAGDLTITENIAEAIKDDKNLVLDLPDGVKFAEVPEVEVTEGDLDVDVDGVKRQTDDNELVIPIDGKSTTPSTIKVSGIKYTVDRTVPEGGITVKIKGDAVNEVNDDAEITDYYNPDTDGVVTIDGQEAFALDKEGGNWMIWPQSKTAAKADNATCVTPAPGEKKAAGAVVFTIGDTKYKVGDKEETMDVAPYVKNNRTYLPVRYAAYALGVSPSNILWDNSNGTVTLIKGDRVIQVKMKSKVMLINGASITMDVAPEIKDGRTMLPFRWIAQALGASVQWDEATKTVTMEL